MSSILDDVKHMLGLLPGDTSFNSDVVIHINSVFATLQQLGVGPDNGYMIMGATEQWDDFFTDMVLNPVKSYMFLRVKLLFDPPQTGFTVGAMERQIQELEYRLFVAADNTPLIIAPVILDGGGA